VIEECFEQASGQLGRLMFGIGGDLGDDERRQRDV